jgi:spore maturation protein CgeB
MKIVVFGLTISSSWGNGHATLWRGLCRAVGALGHHVVFYERAVPYYAATRDLMEPDGCTLVLYDDWHAIESRARNDLREADAGIVTSYCPDALAATDLLRQGVTPSVFYDLDTPVTLSEMRRGKVPYIGERGLADFDLVLSYTGGTALEELRRQLGARLVAPLYGHVDPDLHRPAAPIECYRADLSYLGTYAADRQPALEALFLEPARRTPGCRFLIGGAQYPDDFPWLRNLYFVRHMPPPEHPAFFSSSRLTLNVTRPAMAEMGWCPSGRLFEAAACGTPVITDVWAGLDSFFTAGSDIMIARTTGDVADALQCDDAELRRVGQAARERVLEEHTSAHRAQDLLSLLNLAVSRPSPAELVEA